MLNLALMGLRENHNMRVSLSGHGQGGVSSASRTFAGRSGHPRATICPAMAWIVRLPSASRTVVRHVGTLCSVMARAVRLQWAFRSVYNVLPGLLGHGVRLSARIRQHGRVSDLVKCCVSACGHEGNSGSRVSSRALDPRASRGAFGCPCGSGQHAFDIDAERWPPGRGRGRRNLYGLLG